MPNAQAADIAPATGKLGVLLPGMGAVGTTFIAGCLAVRKGLAKPIGSLTQMGTIRLGGRSEENVPLISDYVPLANLDDLVFGGWDVFEDDAYVAASRAGVLDGHMLEQLGEELRAIKPMTAVFEQAYVKNLHGDHIKEGASKWDLAEQLANDINSFSEQNGCDRLVAVWCGSTEVYREPTEVHQTLAAFEQGLGHARHHPGLGDGLAVADRQRGVLVGAGGQRLVDEQVARHGADRVEHALVGDAVAAQALDQAVAHALRGHSHADRLGLQAQARGHHDCAPFSSSARLPTQLATCSSAW